MGNDTFRYLDMALKNPVLEMELVTMSCSQGGILISYWKLEMTYSHPFYMSFVAMSKGVSQVILSLFGHSIPSCH